MSEDEPGLGGSQVAAPRGASGEGSHQHEPTSSANLDGTRGSAPGLLSSRSKVPSPRCYCCGCSQDLHANGDGECEHCRDIGERCGAFEEDPF